MQKLGLDREQLSRLGIEILAQKGDTALKIQLHKTDELAHGPFSAIFNPDTKRWTLVDEQSSKVPSDVLGRGDPTSIATTNGDAEATTLTDWTAKLPDTDHVQFFRSTNWAATPLGALQTWRTSLRLAAYMLLADSRPACIFWGKEKTAIYNEHYIPLAVRNHPRFMGSNFKATWPEAWETFDALFKYVDRTGIATRFGDSKSTASPSDQCIELALERHGYVEETYFEGDVIPIRGEDLEISGYYVPVREITRQVIFDRRSRIISSMIAVGDLRLSSIWSHILSVMKGNEREFPAALVYSADPTSNSSRCTLTLEGSLGIPAGHAFAPEVAELGSSNEGFVSSFRKAQVAGSAILSEISESSLPKASETDVQWRAFGQPSTSAITIPLLSAERVLGFLVTFVNPRRPYDEEYSQFAEGLGRQLSSILSTILAHEQAEAREARLSKELAESEKRIRRMAEMAPVGMYQIASDGTLVWANSHWYEMMGHSRAPEDHFRMSFLDCISDDDRDLALKKFTSAIEEKIDLSFDLRLKKKFVPPSGLDSNETMEEQNVSILALAYPQIENDKVVGLMGCMADISQFKWAEAVQARSAEAARVAKRRQEEFIDVVSHEMRNPLSAIIQSVESIYSSLDDVKLGESGSNIVQEALGSVLDAANTIMLCALHQKRIVDDVLTLSKLDSSHLTITPVIVNPKALMIETVNMFKAEFASNDIQAYSECEPSFEEHKVERVFCDPSRLRQVLINLLTNAIKFTKSESKRVINISLGASIGPPSAFDDLGVIWFSNGTSPDDVNLNDNPTLETDMCLYFAVKDTGQGLDPNEIGRLSKRFYQASQKTHIYYGGSGLGLYISRRLTEIQGGKLGAISRRGEGSTFVFYIKVRSASEPESAAATLVPTNLHRQSPSSTFRGNKQVIVDTALSKPQQERKHPHILLVEDNIVNQRVLGKQLEKAGCVVHIANNGVEALSVLATANTQHRTEARSIKVDVVLMDMEMPIMNGSICTSTIRQLEAIGSLSNHVPIIAITANAREEQLSKAIAVGMDDVMPKPFLVSDLLNKINHLCFSE